MLDYLDVLTELHLSTLPDVYLEIGVHRGDSLRLADASTTVIGVDPEPDLAADDPLMDRVVVSTSDEFFASGLPEELCGGRQVDLTFVDGMHLFDFALRDFVHAERLSGPDSLIVIHDVLPLDAVTASRDRSTDFWTGDVWKLVLCLLDRRPDLDLRIIDVPPSGLCLVRGLSPADGTLLAGLEEATAAYIDLSFPEWERRLPDVRARTTENSLSRAWAHRRALAAAADEDLSRLTRDRGAATRESETLREDLGRARDRVGALEAELAAARAGLTAETARRHDIEERLRHQSARVDELQHQLRAVAESLSWRVTAPGRSLRGVFKGPQRH